MHACSRCTISVSSRNVGPNAIGVILTGMGADGVNGLELIRKYGGKTIAESKETCILYGMPKIAADRGVADLIVPNYEVKLHMIKHAKP